MRANSPATVEQSPRSGLKQSSPIRQKTLSNPCSRTTLTMIHGLIVFGVHGPCTIGVSYPPIQTHRFRANHTKRSPNSSRQPTLAGSRPLPRPSQTSAFADGIIDDRQPQLPRFLQRPSSAEHLFSNSC